MIHAHPPQKQHTSRLSRSLYNAAAIVIAVLQIQSTMTTALLFAASQSAVFVSWRSITVTVTTATTRTSAAYYVFPSLLHRKIDRQICMLRQRHSTRRFHGLIDSRSSRGGVLSAAGNDCNNNNIVINDSFMDHMLYRINEMNVIPNDIQSTLIDFVVDGRVLGRVTPQVAQLLIDSNTCEDEDEDACRVGRRTNHGIFELSSSSSSIHRSLPAKTTFLTLDNEAAGTTFDQRTQSVSRVMTRLHNLGYISGWRNESYPVTDTFDNSKQPLFLIERAAAPMLGLLEYGVHVNGLVEKDDDADRRHDVQDDTIISTNNNQDIQMWMARRSYTKSKYPGYVDHIVAGGQPYGLSLMENVIKECLEEAGIPSDMVRRGIRPAGAISYETYSPISPAAAADDDDDDGRDDQGRGLGVIHRVVLFCFDLYLPQDFVPKAVDGEVDSFFLWGMEDIVKSMDPACMDPIKPNCYPGK